MSWDLALRHHVERSLRRDMGIPGRLEPDEDDDYTVFSEGAVVWVRPMLEQTPALARVWSLAASDVKKSAALLRELNDLNGGLEQVRCVLRGRSIAITAEVEIESISPGQMGRLVHHVGGTTRHVGELITTVHGGAFPFTLESEPDDADHAT